MKISYIFRDVVPRPPPIRPNHRSDPTLDVRLHFLAAYIIRVFETELP